MIVIIIIIIIMIGCVIHLHSSIVLWYTVATILHYSLLQSTTTAHGLAASRPQRAPGLPFVRLVHLLRVVLLRVLESNFPGDSL